MDAENLKLTIADDDDLMVLSTLLQDATVLIGDMGYDDGSFMMVAARFISPQGGGDTDNRSGQRRLMGVNFSGLTGIKRKGFSPHDRDDVLNLLAIRANGTTIELVFSGAAMVRLECPSIKVYAADLGEGWVTSFQPKH